MNTVGAVAAELGYDRVGDALIRVGDASIDTHPFAPELRAILGLDNDAAPASAVFCLDRVPTVCLVDRAALQSDPERRQLQVRRLCERLWNQNLARLVIVASDDTLEAWSVDNSDMAPELATRGSSAAASWSFKGLVSGDVLRDRDKWFDPGKRVDRELLENISALVEKLQDAGHQGDFARHLVARIIFVTYLEDRGIVGAAYRETRRVRALFTLLETRDSNGLTQLFSHLKNDFNGDFLSTADGEAGWTDLSNAAFELLHEFLGRTSLRTGQRSFWRYDFSQIPIELIASIYETFLSEKDTPQSGRSDAANRRRQGAYYTPRVLADWVVDLALQGRDILKERICDPACGSGMLLTAAYRRLIRAFESAAAQRGEVAIATFATRKSLLLKHIFGADLDEDACQLTGFSLYLALLADLSPIDLAELRAGGHKLPSLTANIRRGPEEGDFFSERASTCSSAAYTLVLSNPPWRNLRNGEPELAAMNKWRARQQEPQPRIPKNQVAGAFALGVADMLERGGRAALILPIGLLISNDKAQCEFRAHLLGRFRIRQVVNFADMRRLIFAESAHPFVVLIAEARLPEGRFGEIEGERFEYWTPKADMSFALGRLAVHGADRADLPASALIDPAPQLGMRYWGGQSDVALLHKLRRHGRLGDLVESSGWAYAKGFHLKDEDRRRQPDTWYTAAPSWMSDLPFLSADQLPSAVPIILREQLVPFPFKQIAREPLRRLFEGPRVIWPDGAHPTDGVKAFYAEEPFTVRHSLAVLSAPQTPDGRMMARFLTVYLRSPLALWLLLLLSGSFAGERPKLHLQEALDWPFWPLDRHPEPERAIAAITTVNCAFEELSSKDFLEAPPWWESQSRRLNRCIYDYFGLSESEVRLVEELGEFAGPALQPTSVSFRALSRPIRSPPSRVQVELYCRSLVGALERWRDITGGIGKLSASAWTDQAVPVGAAVLSLGAPTPERIDDNAVAAELLTTFNQLARAPSEDILTIPDLALVSGPRIYLIKPMIARFWLERTAIEDASRLALQLQAVSGAAV